jgi:UDP-GlcNAc:undecaprenyl-phosphate GlcNAc-1-phosphate transferase
LIFILGGIDDVVDLSAWSKFVIEIAAATAVVVAAGAPWALGFSPFAGLVHVGVLEPIIGVLWIVAITNAMNMLDGMDGVASGLGAIAAVALGVMSFMLGNTVAALVLLALAGALLGFLPHNLRKPKTFLGDSGSLAVGFILGSASLVGLEQNGTWMVVPALLALAIPLAECSLTVLRRSMTALKVIHLTDQPEERFVLRGAWPRLFVPDRRHIHHRLLDLGLPRGRALLLLYVLGGTLAVLGVAAVRWQFSGPFVGLVAVATLVYLAPRWLYEELRLLERGSFLPLLDSRLIRSRAFHVAYDAVAVAVSYLAAQALVHGLSVFSADGLIWARSGAVIAAALFGFWVAGLYRCAYRHAGVSEALRASRAVVLGVVLGAGASILGFRHGSNLASWFLFLFFLVCLVVVGRLSFRILDELYQRARNGGRRVVIFGAGRGGGLALRAMLSNPSLGLMPVAFVDDDPGKRGRQYQGFPVYSGKQMEPLLRSLRADDLVVSTRKVDDERRAGLADACLNTGVRLLNFGLQLEEGNGASASARREYIEEPAEAR